MTPVVCRVKHEPEAGKYGDCVRACIASIMDLHGEQVPHFYHDKPDGLTGSTRIREWLAPLGYQPFVTHYPPDLTRDDILNVQGEVNPDAYYILFGAHEHGGDHVVVCKGGKIVHDPSWYHAALIGPASYGCWSIMVIVRS